MQAHKMLRREGSVGTSWEYPGSKKKKKFFQVTITLHTSPVWTPILISSLRLMRFVCTCLAFTGIFPLWPGPPYAEG